VGFVFVFERLGVQDLGLGVDGFWCMFYGLGFVV